MLLNNGKILYLNETDLREGASQKETISASDLRSKSYQAYKVADFAILNLKNKETIILKARVGSSGVVVPQGSYGEFLIWLNENNQSNNKTEKKRVLGGIFKSFWPFN